MSKDHSRLYALFMDFVNLHNSDHDYAGQKLGEFKAGIERHMKWEENILFPLAKPGLGKDTAMLDELLLQHQRIREDLDMINSDFVGGEIGIDAIGTDLEQLQVAHDEMEEEGIYPWLDAFLDDQSKYSALSKMSKIDDDTHG